MTIHDILIWGGAALTLAEEILFGELAEHGGVVHVDLRDGELVFDFETTAEVA